MKLLRIVLLVMLMQSCAGVPQQASDHAGTAWLLDGSHFPGFEAGGLDLPDDDVLGLTPEMRSFVERVLPPEGTDRARLRALLEQIVGKSGIGVTYDAAATYTAAGTFASGSANCLSFALLTIALMRQAGLPGEFNEVATPPIWDMRGNYTLEMYRHVNVLTETSPGQKAVIDLSMEEYDTSYEQRVISDNLAVAQYYNNRAMELLTESKLRDAYRHEVKALTLEPRQSYLWSNLGTIYRRAGITNAAESAYLQALSRDPEDLVATSNLARLYRETGSVARAEQLEARAQRFRERNPYYQYRLAMDAFLAGDYRGAQDRAERAINRYGREHRFHFLLGAAQEMLGEHREAQVSVSRALELTTDSRQAERYRSKWDRLQAESPRG